MKNYYEILGIERDASLKDIHESYKKMYIAYDRKDSVTVEEKKAMIEASRAYKTLKDENLKAEYDEQLRRYEEELQEAMEEEKTDEVENEEIVSTENLKTNDSWFKRNKNRFIAGALVLTVGIAGYFIGKASSKDNDSNNAPIIEDYDENNNQEVNDNTITEDQEENKIERIALTAENFEEEATKIRESLSQKGLDVRPELVDSALIVVNLNHLKDEDIAMLCGEDFDIVENVENMLALVSLIVSHNITEDLDKQITFADFSYDVLDYEMLLVLDGYATQLATDVRNNTNPTRINAIISDIEAFTTSNGTLELTNGNYSKRNLTPGAEYLSEFLCIQMIKEYGNYNNDLISEEIETLVDSEVPFDEVSKELHQLRVNLENVLSSEDRLGQMQIALDHENEDFTDEQKEAIKPLSNLIDNEISIQNIQNSCTGETCLPHIINFDFEGCLESAKTTDGTQLTR